MLYRELSDIEEIEELLSLSMSLVAMGYTSVGKLEIQIGDDGSRMKSRMHPSGVRTDEADDIDVSSLAYSIMDTEDAAL